MTNSPTAHGDGVSRFPTSPSGTSFERPADAHRSLAGALTFVSLVAAAVGSMGAPLITRVATSLHVSLASAQWTLTITLLSGAIATPLIGRLGSGPRRRATVIGTLLIVVAGSVLTVLPGPFLLLLIGRAAQGCGFGLTGLMMGVARDHLDKDRAASSIAFISVASAVGVGLGYPVAGYLTDVGGIRLAYGLGLVITIAALIVAFLYIPAPPPGRNADLDLLGAGLLGVALLALLVPISESSLWSRHLPIALGLLLIALLVLLAWYAHERRARSPLVDLALFAHPAVASANLIMLVAGVGMYLLLSLITRFAQTPHSAGYGFGLTTFDSGLVLLPLSVMAYVAGKVSALVQRRSDSTFLLTLAAALVAGAFVLFALVRGNLAAPLIAMGLLGFGVGAFFAGMPAVILALTPPGETSSAMSVNQVVRSVGLTCGSALGGLILAVATHAGKTFPTDGAFTVASWIGAGIMGVSMVISALLRGQGRRPRVVVDPLEAPPLPS